jgi:hypothetical protein
VPALLLGAGSSIATPPAAPESSSERAPEDAAADSADGIVSIDRHLGIMANPSAPEGKRRESEEALLTALGGGYAPDVRLRIVQALADKVDVALRSLLARHLQDIRDEAREIGRQDVAKEAKRLLKRLEKSREPRE